MLNRGFAFILAALLCCAPALGWSQSRQPELVVIGTGNSLAAKVGAQVGRSPYLLFFNQQGVLVEALDNPHKDSGSAGVTTAEFLAGKGVKVVVCESFGPKILGVMEKRGMRPVEFTGKVADGVKKALER